MESCVLLSLWPVEPLVAYKRTIGCARWNDINLSWAFPTPYLDKKTSSVVWKVVSVTLRSVEVADRSSLAAPMQDHSLEVPASLTRYVACITSLLIRSTTLSPHASGLFNPMDTNTKQQTTYYTVLYDHRWNLGTGSQRPPCFLQSNGWRVTGK